MGIHVDDRSAGRWSAGRRRQQIGFHESERFSDHSQATVWSEQSQPQGGAKQLGPARHVARPLDGSQFATASGTTWWAPSTGPPRRCILNRALYGSSPDPESANSLADLLYIGAAETRNFFNGAIDQIAVYDKTLTADRYCAEQQRKPTVGCAVLRATSAVPVA